MALLVDSSVWSLALRRDVEQAGPEVDELRRALLSGEDVVGIGLILLELLRGAVPQRTREAIRSTFGRLLFLEPTRDDYEAAADLSNTCRSAGVQLASVDALIAQICIAHDLILLSTDTDFRHAAAHIPLRVWSA